MKELGIKDGKWITRINDFGVDVIEEKSGFGIICFGTRMKLKDAEYPEDMAESHAILCADAGNTAQKCGLLPSELLQQRDELMEALAEQKRLYFSLFDEETSCMYCEAKIRRGSAIILCKECAENTEV